MSNLSGATVLASSIVCTVFYRDIFMVWSNNLCLGRPCVGCFAQVFIIVRDGRLLVEAGYLFEVFSLLLILIITTRITWCSYR